MIRTNQEDLVRISVVGKVDQPRMPDVPALPYFVDADGKAYLLPMYGGLIYNVRLGDSVNRWAAEMIQPGASIRNEVEGENAALRALSCLGNRARIVSGAATGKTGIVTGKSGRFLEQVICDFSVETLNLMAPGDNVLIEAYGTGLHLLDYPEIYLRSCSPLLLDSLGIHEEKLGDGFTLSVRHELPGESAGAGAGLSEYGPIGIQMSIASSYLEDELCFGDLVLIRDWDSTYSHGRFKERSSVGVVCQGNSLRGGHGPGVLVFMSGPSAELRPLISDEANIGTKLVDKK
ncbi:MAG: DUF4438 domain-containing protein [Anaerolineaceae bacterium]|nr:DUF4438 domain-containing protein [Anaerolineaceae bacterium]